MERTDCQNELDVRESNAKESNARERDRRTIFNLADSCVGEVLSDEERKAIAYKQLFDKEEDMQKVKTYRDFCQSIMQRKKSVELWKYDQNVPADPFEPYWGRRLTNVLVMLAFSFLVAPEEQEKRAKIWEFRQMTLGNYFDALIDMSFQEDGRVDEERMMEYGALKESFRKKYDLSSPIGKVIVEMICHYIGSWQYIDHLVYINYCERMLADHLENEGTHGRKYQDPEMFFLTVAWDYPDLLEVAPDENFLMGNPKDRFLLLDWDYHPESLERMADLAFTPKFGEVLRKYSTEDRIMQAISGIEDATQDIYLLLVRPYIK